MYIRKGTRQRKKVEYSTLGGVRTGSFSTLSKKKNSLKSLRLRKLLDQSTFAYWALLDLIFHYYSFHLSHRYE